MTSQAQAQRGARVIRIPPPLYCAAGLAGGMAANGLVALQLGGRPATVAAGALVTALGLGLAFTGVAAVALAETSPRSSRDPEALKGWLGLRSRNVDAAPAWS